MASLPSLVSLAAEQADIGTVRLERELRVGLMIPRVYNKQFCRQISDAILTRAGKVASKFANVDQVLMDQVRKRQNFSIGQNGQSQISEQTSNTIAQVLSLKTTKPSTPTLTAQRNYQTTNDSNQKKEIEYLLNGERPSKAGTPVLKTALLKKRSYDVFMAANYASSAMNSNQKH